MQSLPFAGPWGPLPEREVFRRFLGQFPQHWLLTGKTLVLTRKSRRWWGVFLAGSERWPRSMHLLAVGAGSVTAWASAASLLLVVGGFIGRQSGKSLKKSRDEHELLEATQAVVWGASPKVVEGREISAERIGLIKLVEQQGELLRRQGKLVEQLQETVDHLAQQVMKK